MRQGPTRDTAIWLFGVIAGFAAGFFVGKANGQPPRIPLTAATLARDAMRATDPNARWQRKFVWCPAASKEEHNAVAADTNIGLSHMANDIIPKPIAGGALVVIDFAELAPDRAGIDRLLKLWNEMGEQSLEPDFTVHIPDDTPDPPATAHQKPAGPPPAVQKIDQYGRPIPTFEAKAEPKAEPKKEEPAKPKRKLRTVVSPNLGEVGLELEGLSGNTDTAHRSNFPIVSVGWLTSRLLTTKDEDEWFGWYYKFRGLETGKTTLDGYLKSRGVNKTVAEIANAEDKAGLRSHVTMRGRSIDFLSTNILKPSAAGIPVAITNDNFENETDAAKNPIRSLLDHKADGHEVFAPLPSGWIEYTLWDAKNLLVTEAPPKLVPDTTVPDNWSKRLCSAISCIRCHGPDEGWKPFINEAKLRLETRSRLLTDTSRGKGTDEEFRNFQKILARYSGDLDPALRAARDVTDKRTFAVSRTVAKDFFADVSRVYNEYEYTVIDANLACREFGFMPPDDDPSGVKTFERVVPPLDADGLVRDETDLGTLATSYEEAVEDKIVTKGLTITRRQFELIKQDGLRRSQPIHAAMQTNKDGWLVAGEPAAAPPKKPLVRFSEE